MEPWAPFLDFLASLEGVKTQRKKGRPKRSPKGPGMSASSNGQKCGGPKRKASSHQERPRSRPRPDPNQSPDPDQTQNQNSSETLHVPRGTVADIYIYIYIYAISCVYMYPMPTTNPSPCLHRSTDMRQVSSHGSNFHIILSAA